MMMMMMMMMMMTMILIKSWWHHDDIMTWSRWCWWLSLYHHDHDEDISSDMYYTIWSIWSICIDIYYWHVYGIFPYKPSIIGYPHLWKPPFDLWHHLTSIDTPDKLTQGWDREERRPGCHPGQKGATASGGLGGLGGEKCWRNGDFIVI